jgi:hypothetical protein
MLRGLARRAMAIAVVLMLLLVLPATASADIYKWTDEQGTTVYSNTLPENPKRASNVERVAKERVVPPAEQALLERIDNLERRLQSRASAPPAPSVAPPDYNEGSYYYPPPPPPAYVASSAPVYASGYPYPYPYAAYSHYAYYAYPARTFVSRPAFHAGQRGVVRGGSFHRGRR